MNTVQPDGQKRNKKKKQSAEEEEQDIKDMTKTHPVDKNS